MEKKIKEFKDDFDTKITQLINQIKYTNNVVRDYMNSDGDITNTLSHHMYMSKENVKLKIYNQSFSLIEIYNSMCNDMLRKTPEYIYAPLIEECNKNLNINLISFVNAYEMKFNTLIEDLKQMI